MPRHDYHKPRRHSLCGRPVLALPYTKRDGSETVMLFEPWREDHWSDPDAKKYVRYTDRVTLEERARLITTTEPFGTEVWTDAAGTQYDEYPLKQHILACPSDRRSPAFQPDAARRTSPHRAHAGQGP
ncbi:hypothetical protein RN607_00530 [Demequina capsici]|uniref:Uncharacterized protein n=1 Tax=Demequina capsici TaxID=3075620 RepID=A0AA96FCV7_9MICO|nr:hypothetical protein [Demequina sp. PMTSA13]WNM27518.1 hypothetical protein RN607_00530 [Demequina sp. PMTSA13]